MRTKRVIRTLSTQHSDMVADARRFGRTGVGRRMGMLRDGLPDRLDGHGSRLR
jgi:hypothetical protein